MKRRSLAAILYVGVWSISAQAEEKKNVDCDSLVGVWEYVAPSRPGRAILSRQGTKYTGVAIQTWRDAKAAPANAPSTDTEKALAYTTGSAVAYEYKCEGSGGKFRWTARNLFAIRPNEAGLEWAVDMESDGETAKWWSIGPDGKRSSQSGAARRLR
jgi:hypothetical protein